MENKNNFFIYVVYAKKGYIPVTMFLDEQQAIDYVEGQRRKFDWCALNFTYVIMGKLLEYAASERRQRELEKMIDSALGIN